MREWILENIASEAELDAIEKCKEEVKKSKVEAWKSYQAPILESKKSVTAISKLTKEVANDPSLQIINTQLSQKTEPTYKFVTRFAKSYTYCSKIQ